jgi:hypothetical protein
LKGAMTERVERLAEVFPQSNERRLSSSFIEGGNLWGCYRRLPSKLSGSVAPRCDIMKVPGGKLWSISVLVPLCPSQSMTSVAAIDCLVAG